MAGSGRAPKAPVSKRAIVGSVSGFGSFAVCFRELGFRDIGHGRAYSRLAQNSWHSELDTKLSGQSYQSTDATSHRVQCGLMVLWGSGEVRRHETKDQKESKQYDT